MGMNPEESSLQELAARLAREEQINADLQAKLANLEASHVVAQTSVPVSPASEQLSAAAPTMPSPQPVRLSRQFTQRRFSVWQTIFLVALALVIGFTGSFFLVSQILTYRGDGYTITPWRAGMFSQTRLGWYFPILVFQ